LQDFELFTLNYLDMYRILILILLTFLFGANIQAQSSMSLSQTIDYMVVDDQYWRNLHTKIMNGETDTISITECENQIRRIDSLHFPVIKAIFDSVGFPGYDLVGKTSSHNFWLLVQHADKHLEFQQLALSAMWTQVEKKNANGADYAYLVDRVKVNAGELQIYGTQMTLNETETSFIPLPVAFPEQLDARRKSVALPPIDFYINAMNERYFGGLKNEK